MVPTALDGPLAVYYFPQAPGLPVAQKWACGTSYRERGVNMAELLVREVSG